MEDTLGRHAIRQMDVGHTQRMGQTLRTLEVSKTNPAMLREGEANHNSSIEKTAPLHNKIEDGIMSISRLCLLPLYLQPSLLFNNVDGPSKPTILTFSWDTIFSVHIQHDTALVRLEYSDFLLSPPLSSLYCYWRSCSKALNLVLTRRSQ